MIKDLLRIGASFLTDHLERKHEKKMMKQLAKAFGDDEGGCGRGRFGRGMDGLDDLSYGMSGMSSFNKKGGGFRNAFLMGLLSELAGGSDRSPLASGGGLFGETDLV